MPEMEFDIVWPDGVAERCYSPSLVIKDYLAPGAAYPVAEFRNLCRTALNIASDRVQAKYGIPCSRALGQLARIERVADRYGTGTVTVEAFRE